MKRNFWRKVLIATSPWACWPPRPAGLAAQSRGGSLGAASLGGTFYVWGSAWAKLVSEKIPGYDVNVEVTGGPVHNVKLVKRQPDRVRPVQHAGRL
jgi:TRAP-type uncharacterized transport system substrate-binding protein